MLAVLAPTVVFYAYEHWSRQKVQKEEEEAKKLEEEQEAEFERMNGERDVRASLVFLPLSFITSLVFFFLRWMHFFFLAVWGLGKKLLPLAEGFVITVSSL